VLVGPAVHHWYQLLARWRPNSAARRALIERVAADQILFAPAFTFAWLCGLRVLENVGSRGGATGDPTARKDLCLPPIGDIARSVRGEVPALVVANWALWVPAQAVNFKFVPLPLQVLYSNVVALAWNVYLSHQTAQASAIAAKAATKTAGTTPAVATTPPPDAKP
jgi:protein Mpv17